MFFESHEVRTRGMSKTLIRRHLVAVQEICDKYRMVATDFVE